MKYLFGKSLLCATVAIGSLMMAPMGYSAEKLRLWTTEEQPDRLKKQQQLAEDFTKKTGKKVDVIAVTESELGERATAAFAAGDLPDIIYHPLQFTLPWTEAGILDSGAATDAIDQIGKESFAKGALSMAQTEDEYAAVPVDGWTQMVIYRKDLFAEKGLAPPTSFAAIAKAIDALHNPPELYGFVAATKVDENFMSQVLEHVFLANDVSPVNKDGFQKFDEKKTIEALEFYKKLAKASPQGELYWKQSRELYFAGKAAMIIWSPFILDELAGLRDSAPPTINQDPTSRALADKTAIVTKLSGPSNPNGAAWADMRYFGVTADADIDFAIEFIKYSLSDGYTRTLAIAPEGKFPVRRGDDQDGEKYVKAWSKLPVGVDRKAPLTELYPQEMISEIVNGLSVAQRWGVQEGQLALTSKMINTRIINQIVREYIDGKISAEQAVKTLNQKLSKI